MGRSAHMIGRIGPLEDGTRSNASVTIPDSLCRIFLETISVASRWSPRAFLRPTPVTSEIFVSPPRDAGGSNREHALDRASGTRRHCRIDRDLERQRLQRLPDFRQCNPFHMWAQVARPHELDVGMIDRDVVAHGAFRHHDDTRRLFGTDIFDHGSGRSGKICFGHDFRRTLGMRKHDYAGVLLAEQAYLGSSEELMDLAMSGPGDDFDAGFSSNILREILV